MKKNQAEIWQKMSVVAWEVSNNAYTKSNTLVGACVLGINGKMYAGCNIQQELRSHDIHAETNAIGNMVSDGCEQIVKILVVADKELFTPCGSCMDWIVQFSSEKTLVGFQGKTNREIQIFTTKELMPFYPKK
ncbi:hypothetical protein P8625_13240 [Tenacibaculum tangerinum]|uniref:CMP/dCMP-type deaminase domain-containing protein n=1 Tax=Tenacibaculum tangerinum TaxID=3038772 RepID=A0ABY8L4A5_9FLAO|nr:hypothetical protein [Tenacibaculum tangerinum]WGH75028.1 hypothetical protein P8625_13240 [Tenacibaculum tangerinum]